MSWPQYRPISRPLAVLAALLMFVGSATAQTPPAPPPMSYTLTTPNYRFYPGDEVEITVYSAPELNRVAMIGPDGRLSLPLIAPLVAADMTEDELQAALIAAYSPYLRTPDIDVTARSYGSRQVFVGGEVARPGIYEMPAQTDAFQAVMLAGGFLNTARRGQVLVLSRPPGGAAQLNELDLSTRALRRGLPNAEPLSRYDVVYVPRSPIAQLNLFTQQYIRDALPIQFSLYYDLNGDRNN